MILRDYQRACVDAIVSNARNGVRRQLAVLATGAGKTAIFSHLPRALAARRSLFLEHREELVRHTEATLAKVNPGVPIGTEMAERRAGDEPLVVASIQSLVARLDRYPAGSVDLCVVDEAHHAIARSYSRVIDGLGLMNGAGVLVGFTATAGRSDGVGLGRVFEKIVYSKSLKEMIDAGWLVDVEGYRVTTDANLQGVKTTAGDYATGQLSRAVNTEARNALVVDAWERVARGQKTLAFAVDVQHAADLAAAFRARGYRTESVDGSMAKAKRREIIKKFSAGKLDVLANCALLTEGFDVPNIGAVLMARPTKSRGLYTQMLGRGTRTAPGKEKLVLIDFVDNSRRNDVVSLPSLFGLNPELNCRGRKVAELSGRVESAGADGMAYADVAKLEASIERINLFRVQPLPDEVACQTRNAWVRVLDGVFRLGLPERRAFVVVENALGRADLFREKNGERRHVGEWANLGDALFQADKLVPKDCIGAVLRAAKWRTERPTPGQLSTARKLRIPVPKGATKGDVSLMISAFFSRGERIQGAAG